MSNVSKITGDVPYTEGDSNLVFSTNTGWRHSRKHNTARTYQSACQAIKSFAD